MEELKKGILCYLKVLAEDSAGAVYSLNFNNFETLAL